MDGMLVDEGEEWVRQVREVLAGHVLPSILSHAEVQEGTTWDGDPVTYVFVRQSHDDRPTAEEMRDLNQFMWSVKAEATLRPGWRPVHFRFLPAKSG